MRFGFHSSNLWIVNEVKCRSKSSIIVIVNPVFVFVKVGPNFSKLKCNFEKFNPKDSNHNKTFDKLGKALESPNFSSLNLCETGQTLVNVLVFNIKSKPVLRVNLILVKINPNFSFVKFNPINPNVVKSVL